MWSAILLAGTRSPVMGEIKNCSLVLGADVTGFGAERTHNIPVGDRQTSNKQSG